MLTVLAGGVGAARFLEGLVRVVDPREITIIGNTGDDIEIHGLHVSPDLDIVAYTLAGIVDPAKGWGIVDDTFACQEMFKGLGYDIWFNLGDRDLAVHIQRTEMLARGHSLSRITRVLLRQLGIFSNLIPMSDEPVRTMIVTEHGIFHFQEYLIKRAAADGFRDVVFDGADQAKPAPGVLEAIRQADLLIIAPSNPIVSIGAILSVPGIREALQQTGAPIVGVSPIVGGAPVKGPADRLLSGLGIEVSSVGVARLYRDFLDAFVIDNEDARLADRVRELGIIVSITNTMMRSIEDKTTLAKHVLSTVQQVPAPHK